MDSFRFTESQGAYSNSSSAAGGFSRRCFRRKRAPAKTTCSAS